MSLYSLCFISGRIIVEKAMEIGASSGRLISDDCGQKSFTIDDDLCFYPYHENFPNAAIIFHGRDEDKCFGLQFDNSKDLEKFLKEQARLLYVLKSRKTLNTDFRNKVLEEADKVKGDPVKLAAAQMGRSRQPIRRP